MEYNGMYKYSVPTGCLFADLWGLRGLGLDLFSVAFFSTASLTPAKRTVLQSACCTAGSW